MLHYYYTFILSTASQLNDNSNLGKDYADFTVFRNMIV